MKKWIVRLVGLVIVLALIGGCGSDREGDLVTLSSIGRADAPNSMRVQLLADYTHQSPTPSWAKGFDELFTEWAKKNPNWRLEVKTIPGEASTEQQARLLEEARVGRAPDCAMVDSFVLPQFIQQGALQPIDKYFTKEEIDSLFPFAREIATGPDGKLYAYWWWVGFHVLWRNTELVPEAPQNTEELIEAALEAEKKNPNVDGYLFNGGRWEGTTFDNLDHFWSLGGELVDENGKPVFGQSPNREKMLKVLEFLKESVDSGAAPKRVATIADYNEFLAAAEQGTVAMFHGGDFQYAQIKESLPPEEFEKWEVSPVPPMPGGGEATGAGGWTMAALSEDPKKVATCMDFTRSVYMGPANDVTGLIPTTPKQFDTLDTFDEPIYDEFREMLKFGQARPGFAIYPEISTQLQIAIGNTLTGESTPEQALDDAVNTVNRAYEQQQK